MKYKLLFFILLCATLPLSSQAADFVGLVGIPGLTGSAAAEGGLNGYINALYRLSISIAALLAVIKIVAAGAKYMLTDIVPAKEEAKKDIQGALIGLLIVIGAIIILNTVNSDLTKLDLSIATTTIQQGPTIEEIIALQQRSMAERAAALGSRVVVGQCETYWGAVNGFDMLPGETEEQACKRVCESQPSAGGLGGRFIYNYVASSQCEYVEAEAAQCNPINRTCCEGINDYDWYSDHQRCSTEATPLDEVSCEFLEFDVTSPDVCEEEIADCRESGNTVVSTFINTENNPNTPSSIVCTDVAQQQVNEDNSAAQERCEAAGDNWIAALNTCQDPEEVIPPIM